MAVLDYVELPVAAVGRAGAFYGAAFGWEFTGYGPDYAAHEGGAGQLGLNGDAADRPGAILPVIRVARLAQARAAVIAAGGTITRDIFAYPGGRRFHFADPDGLELGVYQPEEGAE